MFGLGLSVIPILLHLLLKAKPKRLIFPALRLIQQNRRQNVRRLQLRHLWLLLLRMLVIALIAFALSRPSLPAANYSLTWTEWLTLSLIGGLGLGCYFSIICWWRRWPWPRNQFLTRRTMLRGGVGCAVALLLLLGVGWPYARRVSAEIKDPAPKAGDNLPVAAVFLFDTSPSMSYLQGNQSRLQAAQQIGRDHLSRLPAGSKVAVASSHDEILAGNKNRAAFGFPAFSLDLQAARSRIDACEIKAGGLLLNDRLRTALMAQEEDRRRITAEQTSIPEEKRQDRYVREIYLFTDLTRTAWREDAASVLKDELARLKIVSIYVIDVGETAPTNVGITSVRPLREAVPAGSSLKIELGISAVGNSKPDQTVEFFLNEDGKMVKRDQRMVTVEKGIERRLTFEIPAVSRQFLQGEFRIVGSDPLSFDDVGYFTIRTLPSLKLLIVAEKPAIAFFWQSAIEYVSSANITKFDTEFMLTSQLSEADLRRFDVIYMINALAPEDGIWTRIHDFVEAGGGVGIFLGAASSALNAKARSDLMNPVSYNTKTAQSILPAELVASLPASKSQSMDVRNSQHVFLKQLEEAGALTELGAIEIVRAWKVFPQESALVVAKYDGVQGFPALIERRVGRGRVMLMTTSVNDPAWNDFAGSPLSFVFADQLTQYLSQQSSVRCNLEVGDEVSLPLDRDRKLKKAVVRMPDFKQRTHEISLDSKSLLLRELSAIGSYQVDGADGDFDYHTGFSLNPSSDESDLDRLEVADLDRTLGDGRYTVNRDPGSLIRNVQAGRVGQEMYSFIVGCLAFVFALEQFTATWFYRTDEEVSAPGRNG